MALQRTAFPPSVRASREFVSAPRAPPPPQRPSLSWVVDYVTTVAAESFGRVWYRHYKKRLTHISPLQAGIVLGFLYGLVD